MVTKYTVKLTEIVRDHSLNIFYASDDYETLLISCNDTNRPGLQLTGYYDYFVPESVQVIGNMEYSYLKTMTPEKRHEMLDLLFSHKMPAVILTRSNEPYPEMYEAAKKHNVSLLGTDLDSATFMAQITNTLRNYLAPRMTIHGVLVEIYGEGLLIIGGSGIGKSETAIELIKRGHRLVADDAVELRRVGPKLLMGSAPEMIRYLIELRGVGIVDARKMFGVGSVLENKKIDFIVDLETLDPNKVYDRLGLEDEYGEYLGVKLPKTTVPVASGRNLAVILEVAAMNNRLRRMGINPGLDLVNNYDNKINNGWM